MGLIVARQTMPTKPQKSDYEQPGPPPPVPPRPQNVSLSDDQQHQPRPMEHHELNPFGGSNPFKQNGNGADGYGQETSFMGDYDSGYQRSETYMNRFVFCLPLKWKLIFFLIFDVKCIFIF